MVFPKLCMAWDLDHEEGWVLKNWCFWTTILERTLESPLGCKEIKPINPQGNQPWIFIGRTDAEAEAPILWPLDMKSWLIRKDPDAGKDWRQEEKGMTEDEVVGWHHLLNGHEFAQALGIGEGQGSLVCCSAWGCRVGHNWATEQQHISDIIYLSFSIWLPSLSVIISIMLLQMVLFHSVFMSKQYFIVDIHHFFFNCSPVSEHLGCLAVLSIVNSASVNIGGACIFSN